MKPSWQDVWWWEPCWGGKIKINRALFSAKLGWCLRASYSPGLEPSKRSLGGASDVKKLVGGPFLYLHQRGPDLKYRGNIWWTRLLRLETCLNIWGVTAGEWLNEVGEVCLLFLEKKERGGNLLHLRNRRIQRSRRKLDTKDWEILSNRRSKHRLWLKRCYLLQPFLQCKEIWELQNGSGLEWLVEPSLSLSTRVARKVSREVTATLRAIFGLIWWWGR